jgi:hypothetical protein
MPRPKAPLTRPTARDRQMFQHAHQRAGANAPLAYRAPHAVSIKPALSIVYQQEEAHA